MRTSAPHHSLPLQGELSVRARVVLILLGVLIAVLSLEVFLRLYGAWGKEPRQAQVPEKMVVRDTRLGYRNNPAYPGIDARGWRNASVLDRADIVTLGDSQTYGYNVSTEAAWPQRLGRLLHLRAYQMAVPGWGPDQYLVMFDEARVLRPRVIVAAYYLGNDIFDAYDFAYRVGDLRRVVTYPVLESFKSTDPKVREDILRAEAIDPDLIRERYLKCDGYPAVISDPHMQQVHDILTAPLIAPLASQPVPRAIATSPRARIGSVLRGFVTYRMAKEALAHLRLGQSLGLRDDYGPPICVHFQDGQLRTIFTAAIRAIALDRTDPRVREGERIGLSAYGALADRCRRAGIQFYVVVIPTKETAFRVRAEARFGHEPYLRDVWNEEMTARSHAFTFFREASINVIDTLPALADVVASGVNPYRETDDSHPTGPGYDAIARAIAERLQRDGLGNSR